MLLFARPPFKQLTIFLFYVILFSRQLINQINEKIHLFLLRLKKNGEIIKGQYKYLKLHPNHKTLYAGDWNHEKTVPTIEDLEPKVQVRCES